MTINANQAHEQAEKLNQETASKIIGALDSKIDEAIYNGDFTITTPILSYRMQEAVREHYENYGYTVVDYHNNMLGIDW